MENQNEQMENDAKVQKRIEEYQREISEQEQELRRQVLTEAGFYEYKNDTIYGQRKVVYEVSDEQYAQIAALHARKKALTRDDTPAMKHAAPAVSPKSDEPPFQIEMNSGSDNSGYAFFFKIIAFVLWIGGAILAVMTSFIENRHGDPEFQLVLFLPTVLTYLLYGGAAMCAAEMLENIAAIRAALDSIRFRKK